LVFAASIQFEASVFGFRLAENAEDRLRNCFFISEVAFELGLFFSILIWLLGKSKKRATQNRESA
jgi:hypothetical protein